MAKVLILHYSTWGHIEQLARAEAEGALAAGVEVGVARGHRRAP